MIRCRFCRWETPLWVRRAGRRINGWARLDGHISRTHPDVPIKSTQVITGTTRAGGRVLDRVRDREGRG